METKSTKTKWFPKALTDIILGIIVAILAGIVINLITGSFPVNHYSFLISIGAIVLFILCLIASLMLLIIRKKIDILLINKTSDNEKAPADKKLSPIKLWEGTLKEMHVAYIIKYKFLKWFGITSLALGVMTMFYVNIKNRTENIKHENKIVENSTAIVDSLNHLNRKLDEQNILILQMTDSIRGIINEIRISKDVKDKK